MPTILNPYLSFKDNARDAMTFYEAVFGGKLTISTFKEFQVSQDPSEDNLIMHAMLVTPNGLTLMAADTPKAMGGQASPNGSISLSGDDEAELTAYYNKLSSGGTVIEPLRKAPWGDSFGMFSDKFGINWMVNIAGKRA